MPQVSVAEVKTPDRRTTFVVNPRAAAGKTGRCWAVREQMLREHFPLGEVLFTRGPGDATHIARDAVERGQNFIVAVGGDGTIHEVVNGLMMASSPETPQLRSSKLNLSPVLGIWPAGSGSDFARGVGIPGDITAALDLLAFGTPRTIDVGRVDCHDESGAAVQRYYLNAADFGMGAVVCARLQRRSRFLPGRPTYLWQTVRALFTFRNPVVQLAVDGGTLTTHKIISVVVANGAYFGGGMCIAPDARIDDGELNLVIIGDLPRLEAVRRLGETFSGNRIQHPDVYYSHCTRLEATSTSPVLIEADGELVGRLPAVFEILPQSLQVIVGPTC